MQHRTKTGTGRRGGLLDLDWCRSLDEPRSRSAFWASFMGWALDAFDCQALPLALAAITATFALTAGEAGLIATVVLVLSAIGGVLACVLADRIGRARTLKRARQRGLHREQALG